MRKVGVSRSTAWRYDKLFNQEEAERAEVLERYSGHHNDVEETLREAADRDVVIEGPATFPVPPWEGASRPTPSAEEPLVADGSFPSGLLERRMRAAQGPSQPPLGAPRAVVVGRGEMPLSEDMGGRLSRPAWMPEEPATFLGGVI
jgi:hypothetical protein